MGDGPLDPTMTTMTTTTKNLRSSGNPLYAFLKCGQSKVSCMRNKIIIKLK
jgi:hypothetical protein